MSSLTHILKYKLLSFIRQNNEPNTKNVLKSIGTFLVYGGFATAVFFFSKRTMVYVLEEIHLGTFLLHRFISVILLIFFIAVNVGNIVVAFSNLYKNSEVVYLLAKPLEYGKLFVVKFLDNFFYSSSTLLMIIIAVLFGYGSYFGLAWWEYALLLGFVFVPFMLTAASLGIIILIGIIYLIHKFGVRIVLSSIALLYLAALISMLNVSSPLKLINEVMIYYPDLDKYFGFLDSPFSRLFPNFWAADAMYWIRAENLNEASFYIALQVTTAVITFACAVLLAKKWYYRSWLVAQEIQFRRKLGSGNHNKLFSLENESTAYSQKEVLYKKEMLLFLREPSQWLHFSVMAVLILIFVASVAGVEIKLLYTYNNYLQTIIYLALISFNTFLISSLALRFAFPIVSLEAESFWKILSSPVSLKDFLRVKFILIFLVVQITGLIINFFSHIKFPYQLLMISSLNTVFTAAALVSLNFGLGILFGTFKERNPIRIASSQGASVSFLLSIIFQVFLIIMLFNPMLSYFELMRRGVTIISKSLIMSSAVVMIVSLIISFVSLKVGARGLRRDF